MSRPHNPLPLRRFPVSIARIPARVTKTGDSANTTPRRASAAGRSQVARPSGGPHPDLLPRGTAEPVQVPALHPRAGVEIGPHHGNGRIEVNGCHAPIDCKFEEHRFKRYCVRRRIPHQPRCGLDERTDLTSEWRYRLSLIANRLPKR